jgi:hypothetical protein
VVSTRTRPKTQASAVLGRREPTYRLVPADITGSRGQEAIDLMAEAGVTLDGWQQDWLIDGMALSGEGWASDEVAGLVSRQNGKTVVLVARGLWGPTLGGEKLNLFAAHQFRTTREAFLMARSLVETEAFARFRPRALRSHGWESIEFEATGGRLAFIARSKASGRGYSPACILLDECFELGDEAMAALKPALSAARWPQLWYASSAPHEDSSVLRRIALRGRDGQGERYTYREWCADPDLAIDDPRGWAQANPSLGTRIDPDYVGSELETLAEEDFRRERLGWWDVEATGGVFDRAAGMPWRSRSRRRLRARALSPWTSRPIAGGRRSPRRRISAMTAC